MTVRLVLNGKQVEEGNAPPSMTALDWLRDHVGQTDVKEGCAEGDCGACAIALGRIVDGQLSYKAVNACIALLGQLDGASVVTARGLAHADGSLHPVQQALVDTDGTQCGFCTPGFAVAMFAFHHGGEPADDPTIHELLAGNLCRCTGYRPIVDACRRIAGGGPVTDVPNLPEAGESHHLGARVFHAPRTLDALIALRAEYPEATLLAGGTDIGLLASKQREPLPTVISTMAVPELRRIAISDNMVEIGAAVTYDQAQPVLDEHFPSLGALLRRIGSRQIRNLGTLGGNLGTASPIGDTLPSLLALDAEILLHGPAGRRSVKADDYFRDYRRTALGKDEVIVAIRLPRLTRSEQFVAYKLSKRFDQDIAAVVAAFRFEHTDGRLKAMRAAYGGMAAVPKRARAVEDALLGQAWTPATLDDIETAMAKDFAPLSDQRGSAPYRLQAAANLLRRLQLESAGSTAPMRLEAL